MQPTTHLSTPRGWKVEQAMCNKIIPKLCAKNHEDLSPRIAEIDNIGYIWWLSNHSITVYVFLTRASSHSNCTQYFVTCYRGNCTTVNAVPIPAITVESVIKLTPVSRYYHGGTIIPTATAAATTTTTTTTTVLLLLQTLPASAND